VFFLGLVFAEYYCLLATYQQAWWGHHFAALGFLIFLILFLVRKQLPTTAMTLLLSDMTYAVYLLHNWLFDDLKRGLARLRVELFNPDAQALMLLLLICFLVTRYVEKPGIRIGRSVLQRFRSRGLDNGPGRDPAR
jgi:peptidoglycan/LPS O-acetylase OafA/YrhL